MLDHKIPPPIVALGFGLLMNWLAVYTWRLNLNPMPHWIIVGLFAAMGVFFLLAGAWSFRQANTTVNPLKPDAASTLVTAGIYQYTRNPMYVGFVCLLIAWACFLAAPLTLILVLAYALYIQRFQIKPEEAALERLFGTDFMTYQNEVRRWL